MNNKVKPQAVNSIPPMIHPLGKHWKQPSVKDIELDDKHALMSQTLFNQLKDYSHSLPGGVYEGKIWRCRYSDGWLLRWWSNVDEKKCKCNQRIILIA